MSLKVFDIYPTLERLTSTTDKSKSKIICLECNGKSLFIGTNDCCIIQYSLIEKIDTKNHIYFDTFREEHKYLGLKKPIVKLKVANALNKLIVLCDECLSMLDLLHLEPALGIGKIKNVLCFSINARPIKNNPFSIEICVGTKRKCIIIYTITEDKITINREISLNQPCSFISMNNIYSCVALQDKYVIINSETSTIQELFPYDCEKTNPIITIVAKNEFLINGPNALGMFVTTEGISQRPPLQWSDSLVSVIVSYPYILALNDEFITIHSVFDQQQKQSIPFQGGQCFVLFNDRILVATDKQIFALIPITLENQIQDLLRDARIDEALNLVKIVGKCQLSSEKYYELLRRVHLKAGFIEFAKMNFDVCKEHFLSSDLDPRELILLYSNLLPSNTEFSRCIPPLHDIADVDVLCKGDEAKIFLFDIFLMELLSEIEMKTNIKIYKLEVDTAILKLLSKHDGKKLIDFLNDGQRSMSIDCVTSLQENNRYFAVGLLYSLNGDWETALEFWRKISDGELIDNDFPGNKYLIECLTILDDNNIVWKYVEWFLKKNEQLAVDLLIKRQKLKKKSDSFTCESIVNFLLPYNSAVVLYLEYLIYEMNVTDEIYHTQLSALYLERVLKSNNRSISELKIARNNLQRLLKESNLYRVQLILGKLKNSDLYTEMAILYGKLEEHEKALNLLVNKEKDYVAAEDYCEHYAKNKPDDYRCRLFHNLLQVYLNGRSERKEKFLQPIISLLNKYAKEFDPIKVMQQLPDNLSIGLISSFLTGSIRKSLHNSRTLRIHRMLARSHNLQIKDDLLKEQQIPINISEEIICSVCRRVFSNSACVRFPNGAISHINCSKTLNGVFPSPIVSNNYNNPFM